MTSLHSPSVHPPSAPLSPSTVSSCPPSPPLESLSDSFGGVKAKLDHLESTIGSTLNISKKQKNFTPFKTRHMSSQQQYGQQYQQQDSDSDVSSLNDSVVITPPRSQTHATHSPRPKRSSALKQRSLNTPTKSLSKTSMKKFSPPSLKKKTFVTTTTTTPLKPPQNLVDQLTQSRQHAQTLQSSVTSSRLQLSSEKNLRLKLERSLTTSKMFNERLEEEVERLKREQEECREEIERKDLKLKEVGREVEVLKEEFDYFKLKYSSGEEKNLKYDLEKKEIELNQLQEELKVEKEKQIKIEKELEEFKEKEREEKEEKERIERRVEEERERERKERERAEGEVRRLKEKLDENESNVRRDVRKWEKEVEAERRKRDRIEGKCEEIRRGMEEEKKNANNLKTKLREVKAENHELKSTTNTSSSELANLHRTIRRLEEEKERTKREREEERGAREEVERKVERLRKEGEERKEIEEENARLKSCILALQTSTTSLNKTYLSERTQRLQLQEQLIHNTSKFKQAMSFFSKELEEVGREQLKIVEREQQVRNINEGVREDIEALKAKRNIERRASELKVEAERLERNPMGRIGERDLEFKAIKASIEEGGRDIHGAFHEGPVGEGARLSPDLGDRDLKLREPIVKPIPTPTTVAVKPPAASSEIGDLKEAIESVKSHLESLTKSANNNSTSSEISKLRRELIEESRSKEVEGLRRMVEGVVEKVEDLKRGNGEVLKEGLEEVLKKFEGIGRSIALAQEQTKIYSTPPPAAAAAPPPSPPTTPTTSTLPSIPYFENESISKLRSEIDGLKTTILNLHTHTNTFTPPPQPTVTHVTTPPPTTNNNNLELITSLRHEITTLKSEISTLQNNRVESTISLGLQKGELEVEKRKVEEFKEKAERWKREGGREVERLNEELRESKMKSGGLEEELFREKREVERLGSLIAELRRKEGRVEEKDLELQVRKEKCLVLEAKVKFEEEVKGKLEEEVERLKGKIEQEEEEKKRVTLTTEVKSKSFVTVGVDAMEIPKLLVTTGVDAMEHSEEGENNAELAQANAELSQTVSELTTELERTQDKLESVQSELDGIRTAPKGPKGGEQEQGSLSPIRRDLESEKRALLRLHEQLKVNAQKQSLELTEQMTDHVRVLREKKEDYERKEVRNKKRRDDEIKRVKKMWEGEVDVLRSQVATLKKEMTESIASGKFGSGTNPHMRNTITEQQRLIKETKEDAIELVNSVIQDVEGEGEDEDEDDNMQVNELVNDLSRELKCQDDIVKRLRSR